MKKTQGGFATLLSLVIAVGLIGFFIYSYLGKTDSNTPQTVSSDGTQVVTVGGAIAKTVSSGGKKTVADDTFVISTMNAVRSAAQMYYADKGDYNSFCTADTNGSKFALDSIALKVSGGRADISCADGRDSFAVSVKLSSGAYVCVDGFGHMTRNARTPNSGTVCGQ